ncbi:uncharacterized protein ARMOST_09896 [Armillaria ostoyae]|uniref:Uncharacterized protein n=1 Tax=Armillaria ostoyae TaxID=47428 RepID=A0A284RCU7_ARMOS|nr:uncharacterized protein ARMOST_09896 [Armillaria ostoyae]
MTDICCVASALGTIKKHHRSESSRKMCHLVSASSRKRAENKTFSNFISRAVSFNNDAESPLQTIILPFGSIDLFYVPGEQTMTKTRLPRVFCGSGSSLDAISLHTQTGIRVPSGTIWFD